ncbi:MAG: glycosyltransferase [Gammaproteobacteria bacterium]|nr:glycosyltransferase [Gammaproteobacteria bacterium]
MNNIVFLSFVYPGSEKFLDDFFKSLQAQTIKDFDVYIINDELENFIFFKKKFKNLKIIDINYHNSPVKIREFGINLVLNKKYDLIIFGDADDYFAENRIEVVVNYLQNYDVVVNDLHLVSVNKNMLYNNYLSNRVADESVIDLDFIKEKNLLGFSNTAIRGDILNKINLPEGIIAADWYFFSRILMLTKKIAIFTNKTATYYRQHQNNIAGFKEMDKKYIPHAINVKLLHYRELAKRDARFKTLEVLLEKLRSTAGDPIFLNKYFEYLRACNIKNPLWWEMIKTNKES